MSSNDRANQTNIGFDPIHTVSWGKAKRFGRPAFGLLADSSFRLPPRHATDLKMLPGITKWENMPAE